MQVSEQKQSSLKYEICRLYRIVYKTVQSVECMYDRHEQPQTQHAYTVQTDLFVFENFAAIFVHAINNKYFQEVKLIGARIDLKLIKAHVVLGDIVRIQCVKVEHLTRLKFNDNLRDLHDTRYIRL